MSTTLKAKRLKTAQDIGAETPLGAQAKADAALATANALSASADAKIKSDAALDATQKANAAKVAAESTAQTLAATAKAQALVAAATDATNKANAAQTAAEAVAEASAAAAKAEAISSAIADATSKSSAAKEEAISAAALDAQTKADLAKAAAINIAATDAQNKANTAKNSAISAAATDAQTKADLAKAAAISAASTDATNKSNAAKSSAISAAAADATNKSADALAQSKDFTFDSVKKWTQKAVVSATVSAELLYNDGSPLPAKFPNAAAVNSKFFVTAITTGSATISRLTGVLQHNGTAWVWEEVSSLGAGSNHPIIAIVGGKPMYSTSHATGYTVSVIIEWANVSTHIVTADFIQAGAVRANAIEAGAIIAGKLAANSVATSNLVANAITADKILAGAITAGKLAVNSVVAANILAGEIGASHLAAGSVIAGKIAAGAIVAADIKSGTITGAQIAANTITTTQLAANSVTAAEIAANAITSVKIAANQINAAHIIAGSITAALLAADSVTAASIKAGSIAASHLAVNSVLAASIKAGQISTAHLVAGAVTADTIAASAITSTKIAANAITASAIAAGAIGTDHLSAGSIDASKIKAGAITAAQIATGTITASQLAANSVTTSQIAANAVTSNEIASNSIISAKIAANAITAAHVSAGSIGANQIASNAIIAVKIAAGAITADKIAANQIQSNHITAGAITSDKINVTELSAISATMGEVVGGAFRTAAVGEARAEMASPSYGSYWFAAFKKGDQTPVFSVNRDGSLGMAGGTIKEYMLDPTFLDTVYRIKKDAVSGGGAASGSIPSFTVGARSTLTPIMSAGGKVTLSIVGGGSFSWGTGSKTGGVKPNITGGISVTLGLYQNNTLIISKVFEGAFLVNSTYKLSGEINIDFAHEFTGVASTTYNYELRVLATSAIVTTYKTQFQIVSFSANEPVVGNQEPVSWNAVVSKPDLMMVEYLNGYRGMTDHSNGASSWVRTTVSGIIPYQSGVSSAIGTSSWRFASAYINSVFGNLIGNADTATRLATARSINGVAFDGSANITIADNTKLPLTGGTLTGGLTVGYGGGDLTIRASATNDLGDLIWADYAGTEKHRLYDGGTGLYYRHNAGTSYLLIHAGNYNSYSPTLTGTGASGTWGISVSGNSATATTLQTARTINGVSFNGSANITVADSTKLPLAGGTLTGNLTAPVFNLNRAENTSSGYGYYSSAYNTWQTYMSNAGTAGSGKNGNITAPTGTHVTSWAMRSVIENSLGYGWTWESMANGGTTPSIIMELNSQTGAMKLNGNLTAGTVYAALSGNATTATTLQTARTIAISGAVTGTATSFNGGANITISATAINASNLNAGTVPDARISGSYTGMANLTGSGTVDFAKFLGNAADTVAAPSFSWTGDTNTGIYRPSAGNVAVAAGGSWSATFSANTISTGRILTTGTGNDYHVGGVEIKGNGTANTVFPTIGFHQPGLYASSLQLRAAADFRFYAQGSASYANVTAGTFIGALSGNAASASKLATARNIALSGELTGSANFDGSGNVSINATVVDKSGIRNEYVDFSVGGDANTYYPVLIGKGSAMFSFDELSITRAFSWTAPDTWHSSTHKGGLTLTVRWSGDSGWGGNDKTLRVIEFNETYSTMVGGMHLSVSGLIVWLRGGGASYRLNTLNGRAASASVTLGTFTDASGATFAARANTNSNASEIYSRMPVRGNSDVYDQGNRVYSAVNNNIGAGASNYSAGNHTHDGRYVLHRNRDNWLSSGVDANVVGQLSWANYGNGHTIFDASKGISPSGTAVDKNNAGVPWASTYPTLMGWNGGSTYGVRVDSARIADNSNALGGLGVGSFMRTDADDSFIGVHISASRNGGIVGTYDSYKTDQIWSMGAAYRNAADGSNFGNLYGFAYKHTNNTTGGTMAGGHQAVWCASGVPKAAIGESGLWTIGTIASVGDLYVGGNAGPKFASIDSTDNWSYLSLKRGGATIWDIAQFNGGVLQFRTAGTGASDGSNAAASLRNDGTFAAGHFVGNQNVGGTGAASHHPSGVFSQGTNWLYGQIITASNPIDAGTGAITCGRLNAGYDSGIAGSVNAENWFRSNGQTGWYSSSYGGGIYMIDPTWVRTYGGKKFYVDNPGFDAIQSYGGVQGRFGYNRNNAGSSWISQKDSIDVGLYSDSTSTSSYAAMIRQRHATKTWTIGGLGDSRFGIYAFYNSRTANGTDGEFSMDVLGNCYASGTITAKSWGTGNANAKVMTWDDFLPANPPAGLEGVITANWLAAGVIQAKHLQVDGISENGGVRTSFKLQPSANVPIRFSVIDGSNNLVEDIFAIDNKGNGFFKGKLSKNTVDINAIDEETRKMINPYYLTSTAGSKQELTASVAMASGELVSLPTITSNGKTNVSWKLNLGSETYSNTGSHLDFSMFQWRVDIYRGQTTTPVFSKTYDGYSATAWDQASVKFKTVISLNIEDLYIDTDPAAAKIFSMRVTKISGTTNAISRKYFGADSPNFITNDLDTNAAGGFSWTDKETGFTVKSGSVSVAANTTLAVTYTRAFSTPYSCSATAVSLMTNEWASASNGIMGAGGIAITNHADRTTTINWIATGYTG